VRLSLNNLVQGFIELNILWYPTKCSHNRDNKYDRHYVEDYHILLIARNISKKLVKHHGGEGRWLRRNRVSSRPSCRSGSSHSAQTWKAARYSKSLKRSLSQQFMTIIMMMITMTYKGEHAEMLSTLLRRTSSDNNNIINKTRRRRMMGTIQRVDAERRWQSTMTWQLAAWGRVAPCGTY